MYQHDYDMRNPMHGALNIQIYLTSKNTIAQQKSNIQTPWVEHCIEALEGHHNKKEEAKRKDSKKAQHLSCWSERSGADEIAEVQKKSRVRASKFHRPFQIISSTPAYS